MKQFNVLDRHTNIHSHHLIEASAGTGKTFSIQNIIVRFLLETHTDQEEPFALSDLLVVTFTRASTRDLRLRIRANIEQALDAIDQWNAQHRIPEHAPDYLIAIFEKGDIAVDRSRKRLQYALFTFDGAQIFTIHAFCAKMLKNYALETDVGLQTNISDAAFPITEILGVIRDYFYTELNEGKYSSAQIAIMLKEDPEQKKLLKAIQANHEFVDSADFRTIFAQFTKEMNELKVRFGLNKNDLISDFKKQYELYKNYKAGETKTDTLAKGIRFAGLFDKESWEAKDFDLLIEDGLVWVAAFNPSLLKARAGIPSDLCFPNLSQVLKEKIDPLLSLASHFPTLLSRLANECRQLLKRYQNEEEKSSPDDLLRKMSQALNQEKFLEAIRAKYRVAIIDEFQDTDPIQWKIFKTVFLSENRSWNGIMYLVGDPKQSIYSFREADIYTYIDAAQTLGSDHCFSLNVNYRSQPSLVHSLNAMFSAENIPTLIPLPKIRSHLPYHPVEPSNQVKTYSFNDERGAIHHFIADCSSTKKSTFNEVEKTILIPFIVQEIESLVKHSNVAYHQIAILTRDRYQAARVAELLEERKIPYINQRGASLVGSQAYHALIDILYAVLHPNDSGAIKIALGNSIIGWTYEDVMDQQLLDFALIQFLDLRHILFQEGISRFFHHFMQSKWKIGHESIIEQLLSREDGIDLYRDLQQLINIITDHRYTEWYNPEGIIPFLNRLKEWEYNDDERIKRFQNPLKEGVKILTLHVSKGLEFDIVFALGLVNRIGRREDLIPIEQDGKIKLFPVVDHMDCVNNYFEEVDAEKMRQLYVAMTRAKYRLYVPFIQSLSSSNLEIGGASPIDLFVAQLHHAAPSYEALYERIRTMKNNVLIECINSLKDSHAITYSLHQTISLNSVPTQKQCDVGALASPQQIRMQAPPITLTSFSGLIHEKVSFASGEDRSAPHDFNVTDKNVHTLPAGSHIGVLLHTILEKIPFQALRNIQNPAQCLPLVLPHLKEHMYEGWEDTIAQLVYNTLKTSLNPNDPSFCLCNIKSSHLYKEMSFTFPYDNQEVIESLSIANGFIKGVIDCLFCYQDIYYLVDWKSNWLGEHMEDYEQNAMEIAMMDCSYHIQASIYTEALKRYLKLVDPRPFEICFGGAYYLFLRGISPEKTTGIYSFIPTPFFTHQESLI